MPDNEHAPDEDTPNFRKLREKVERLEAENNELRSVAAKNMVQVAGYDPSNRLTELVLNQFLGSDEVELTPDRFKAFAAEYNLPSTGAPAGDEGGTDNSDAFDALQAGADELRQATRQAAGEPSVEEQIANAEADGDFDTARALKTEKIRAQLLANR